MGSHNLKIAGLICIGFALLSAGAQVEAAPAQPTLSNPQVRLWYEETGKLSGNIAGPNPVTLWNICIGEGEAEEIANDALFTVDVRPGEQNASVPLTLAATGPNGKVIASRTYRSILTGESGSATLALWVPEVGCGVGRVVFSARLGGASQSLTLDFDGGE